MSALTAGLIQLAVLVFALALVYRPAGAYLASVYTGTTHNRIERLVYRLVRVDPDSDQRWSGYAIGVLGFSLVSILLLYLLQRLQALLPLDLGRGAVEPGTAFNTAVSFATNTNWQSYVPEQTLGHLVQTVGLTVQNFVSAAVGMAVAVALVRGFVRAGTDRIGNVWVDITRGVVRVLLPVALFAAVLFVAAGVVMSFAESVRITGLDGVVHDLPLAPAASQEAIKILGTNGGGIYNANSAHPFENPAAWTNVLQIFLLLVIPVCLTRAFGIMVGNRRQGNVLIAVVGLLWSVLLAVTWWAETHAHGPATLAAGAALEGKETRFDITASVLFAVSTTGTSTGAVNAMHDSFSGLGGGAVLLNILLGEIAPGGVGSGLYGLLVIAVLAVFLAGLMVGRSPEYLGKRIGRVEISCAAISMLAMPAIVLLGTGTALLRGATREAMTNGGAHGLSEVLYAYASAGNNNGSAFAGLTVTDPFFQATLGVAMLLGRLLPIIAVLALAGALARQRAVSPSEGTLPTDGPLFAGLLTGTAVLFAALTFLPALALGPIAEALA
ncbi:potassium-transporting ATPase subunit KdpA [Actinoalloteichus hymeniacidonis]|uniref:Potassium-transporting ATPase potassium-binding subunit n=1 Tax=Actinoalloteichus hymeniacidonis TaxID=340345 RepID=A0AAC9HVF4_9PSEU|nr:potassium-transporting ATPase subunit KdpA [Actinoalloteichus hymeniacidonis]AOS65255.1 K+-transporting ATPase, KdpA [Actinoalloteichus hymeniacidonis]MBB5906664.1 K+-transporting ATPase ATPase A chain [Actinoalloteichus hymeniacidonis]